MHNARPLSGPKSIGTLLDEQGATDGGRAALLSVDGRSMSRAELAQRTRHVASRLARLGIGCADRVAVVAPNSVDMAVALLGVMRSAACAPLNPLYTQAEIEYFFADLQVRALVVTADSPPLARDLAMRQGVPVIEVGAATHADADPSAGPDLPPAGEEDIALVLHTSGTTSKPKQVPLSHANLAASMANIAASLQLVPEDRALNVMPLFHIHGLLAGLLAPLASGASVVCPPALQLPAFFDWLERFGVTWYSAVPTMHQAIVAAAPAGGATANGRPRLRFIRSSSSALAPATLAQLEALFGCPVIEAYGMTEAAHQMASNPLPPRARKPGAVGLPAGPEVRTLTADGRFCAAGEEGEIVIRGPNVTAGYANNPEANAGAFAPDPAGGAPWFRTGDLGVFDADGYLAISGRIKEIINRGGEKIAPREVDDVLTAHPQVKQAVTFAIAHPKLGEEVAAALVLREGATVSERDIRDFAAARLASFKVPARVLFVDEIPKGSTGKLTRIGLAKLLGLE